MASFSYRRAVHRTRRLITSIRRSRWSKTSSPRIESGQIETVQSIIGVGGGTSAFIVVRLPDWAERDFTQQELIAQISGQLSAVPGVQVSARSTNSLNIRGAGGGLSFAVTGTNLAEMTEAADRLTAAMAQDATFLNPQLSNNSVTAQLEVTIDDSAAGDMGLNSSDVSSSCAPWCRAMWQSASFRMMSKWM